jgi:cell division protein FtsW (lipid II flippase)
MISAGGTSLLATLSMLALVQNVAIHRPRVPLAGLAPRDDR